MSYTYVKGGYLNFSHLTELKNIYITEICMKKQYKSPRIKNHKMTFFLMVFPLPFPKQARVFPCLQYKSFENTVEKNCS